MSNKAFYLHCDTPGHVYKKAFVDTVSWHVLLFLSFEHRTPRTAGDVSEFDRLGMWHSGNCGGL